MDRVNVADNVIPHFDRVFDAVMRHTHTDFWLKGGRGSTKSSFVSICILLLVVSNPFANAVIVRRQSNVLRDTVYNQMLWAVAELGLGPWFKVTKTPMELTYTPTGQKIVFRGLDDPLKTKGVKFTKGYCAIQWFEEIDQIETWDNISSALRSFRRGGDTFWTFYTYNPPRVMWSWVNKKALEMERRPSCLVDHSTYLDVLEGGHADWLGEQFVEDAEYERVMNGRHYRWEFLGEVTGTGGSVFENVRAVHLTDEEIAQFDNHRNGVDWGWFPDPWHFVRCEWQPGNSRLVVFDEARRTKTPPQETARIVRDKLTYPTNPWDAPTYHAERVDCDDANPSDIRVYRDEGVKAMPAQKGNMRRQSYTWLAGLREIAIDPDRCPHAFEEFSLCEYMKDRDGNWVDDFPDGNDHCLTGDALVCTESGEVPIRELVGEEGKVWSYDGAPVLMPFRDVRMTRRQADIYRIELEDGRELRCTGDHLVLTERGWVEAMDLTESDEVVDIRLSY